MIQIMFIILVHNVWATQMLLSEARHLVKVVPYTLTQRRTVAEAIVDIVGAVMLILIRYECSILKVQGSSSKFKN